MLLSWLAESDPEFLRETGLDASFDRDNVDKRKMIRVEYREMIDNIAFIKMPRDTKI